jgi:hypothetical protein
MATISSTISQPPGRTLFSFLRRNSDGMYYNTSSEEFQIVNLPTADEATRAPFRVAYVEAAGSYTWTIDVTDFLNGSYTYTTQERSGVVEYAPIQTQTLSINGGALEGQLLTSEIAQEPDRVFFSYICQKADETFYVPESGLFEDVSLTDAPEELRDTFRVYFTETSPGTYSWEVSVEDFANGTYIVSTRELVGELEIQAGQDYPVGVYNGLVVSGVSLGEVGIDHNTGSKDSLRYVTSGGAPIQGAKICVYSQSDLNTPLGVTFTNKYGRWQSSIQVPTGNTYTITFAKSGLFGPDSTTIDV